MNIDKFICGINSNIITAWKIINENTKGTVFIIDEEKHLKGVITDGDIRRHLIKGGDIGTPIHKILNKSFVYGKTSDSYTDLIKMVNQKIKIIPLVDMDFQVVDFFEYRAELHIPVAIPDLKGNEFKYLTDAFLSTWISSSGEYIRQFEKKFANFCSVKYGIATSNGTVALHLALKTLEINKDDEVIVPDLTFAATINAVIHTNATPVIVDVDEESWTISPKELEKAITKKTKAIIPVHIYGQPCNMNEIIDIARQNNIYVVEDCAQAHGAEFNDKKVGSFGDISCFSFFGNKVITTGEGGMCITNSEKLKDNMEILRDHGMSKTKKYWHDKIGYNYRMTNLQAAIGLAQIERINDILLARKQLEDRYISRLSGLSHIEFQPSELQNRKKITWLVCILVNKNRDQIIHELQRKNIDVRPFFYPLSSMDIYKPYYRDNKTSLKISSQGINLPTNNTVDDKIIEEIYKVLVNNK